MAAAIFTDDVGLVEMLMKHGGAVYYYNKKGGTPLTAAIENKRYKIASPDKVLSF